MAITRKTFLIQLASGGWVLAGSACGGGGDGPAPPVTGCSASISGNHGHVLTIPSADLNSTVDMSYDIHGTADHTHTVTFSAAQLAQLKAGTSVSVNSTTTLAHNHAISERCT